MEPLGRRRLPSTSEIDLRVEKTLRVRSYTVGVYADVFNLTDRVVATRYNEVSGSTFGASATSASRGDSGPAFA